VGHSNGTYLFGQSLRTIPGMRFTHAVLVGSVLPCDYDWRTRVANGQIKSLSNLRSNADFPVSFLCSGLRGLGMKDVGPGGFDGFGTPVPGVTTEVYWFNGGHSEPLRTENIPSLARAILGLPDDTPPITVGRESRLYATFPRLAPWVLRLLFLAVAVVFVWLVGFSPTFSITRLAIGVAGALTVLLVLDLL
jgi:hypothetical protein